MPLALEAVTIRQAATGDQAGARGAAILAMHKRTNVRRNENEDQECLL